MKLVTWILMMFLMATSHTVVSMTPLDAVNSIGDSPGTGVVDLQHTNSSVFDLAGFFNSPLGPPHYHLANDSIEYLEMIAANDSLSSV